MKKYKLIIMILLLSFLYGCGTSLTRNTGKEVNNVYPAVRYDFEMISRGGGDWGATITGVGPELATTMYIIDIPIS